jgi:hypothetical protein
VVRRVIVQRENKTQLGVDVEERLLAEYIETVISIHSCSSSVDRPGCFRAVTGSSFNSAGCSTQDADAKPATWKTDNISYSSGEKDIYLFKV